MIKVLKH